MVGTLIFINKLSPTSKNNFYFACWLDQKETIRVLKNVLKKAVSILTAAVIIVSGALVQSTAKETPTFTVSDAVGNVGEEVMFTVECSGNPGITAWKVDLHYDSNIMELLEYDVNGVFGTAIPSQTLQANPFVISWCNGISDVTANGKIADLKFRLHKISNFFIKIN